jgi:hypothetical protein
MPVQTIAIIVGSVLAVIIVGYFLYPVIFAAKREAEVQTAALKGDTKKAGISDKNRLAAKAALNAIGELESVTSVGTNYQQYTSTLQSAKIKFDAAIRDLEAVDEAELAILRQLEEAMLCHVDAKNAWTEFIRDGDKYGFIGSGNSVLSSLASKYSISSSDGEYFNSTVLRTIWAKASDHFKNVELQLR